MPKQQKKARDIPKADKKAVQKTSYPRHIALKGFLSFFILHELGRAKLSGDDLASRIGARKGSDLTSGTIYPALKRLRRQKLIRYSRDGRKKIYFLTQEGKAELKGLYAVFSDYFFGLKGRLKC